MKPRSLIRLSTGIALCALLTACGAVDQQGAESDEISDTGGSKNGNTSALTSPAPSNDAPGQRPPLIESDDPDNNRFTASARHIGLPTMVVTDSQRVQFGAGVDGVQVWLTALVSDDGYELGDLVTASFNVYNADGEVLSSASESYRFWTGNGVILSVLLKMPEGIAPADADVTVQIEPNTDTIPLAHEQARVEILSEILVASKVEPTLSFNLQNTSELTAVKSRLDVICYDDDDRIVGGGQVSPPQIRPSQRVAVETPLITTGSPDRCDKFLAVLMSQ
ncbi:MAG: hypothetical protein Q4P05_07030 [Actinomycetaceae bacterium]|nr:hypothetical protein [Actinomycetaceae bacterium]